MDDVFKRLRNVVDRNGLHVDPDKVKAMLQLAIPENVRRLVGTFSWYRRFIPEFATVLSPITALLKKSREFVWSLACDDSFEKMKEYYFSPSTQLPPLFAFLCTANRCICFWTGRCVVADTR
ncbi:hypothetical protein JTB14_001343 [Gonioctena quinquepunctata]|nr:hypothetical protein JTB14_001343 [Gonioctena quinquepunctata]